MKIIIAGAGEVGTHLAKMLSQEKHAGRNDQCGSQYSGV